MTDENIKLEKKPLTPFFLSIVFSFRNEEDVLKELLSRMRAVMQKEIQYGRITDYEMIFVNDASNDRSLDILRDLVKIRNDIRIVNLSRTFGVTAGVLAGMAHSSGDAVIYMDCDLQDPPEVIHDMLDLWFDENPIEIIHTIRNKRVGEHPVKMFLTKLGYTILHKISGLRLPMEAGDFKMLSRRAVNHLLAFNEKKPYIRGLIYWMGFKYKFLPYTREARFAGQTKFPIYSWKVISNFTDSALISFSSIPLKIASILGLSAILIDLLFMTHALLEKIQGKAIPGWTAIMVVVLFLGGVQLFCLGIVGLYLNAIFEQSMDRPRYIIESTEGFPKHINPLKP
ncbi:MAG: glycosyltransferase family 2 protein [Candidatus Omnitrophica bacterium]|nr:glycosyltransferase family 2 protein [Candidatus Omnitrophota bacterium]